MNVIHNLLLRLFRLAGQPELGRDGGPCSHRDLQFCCNFFCNLPQIYASIPLSEACRQLLELHALACALTSTVGPYIDKLCPIHWIYHSWIWINIWQMLRGSRMNLSSILSIMAKAVNVYVIFCFLFFKQTSLWLCDYGELCVEFRCEKWI